MNTRELLEAIGGADEIYVKELLDCMNEKKRNDRAHARPRALGTLLVAALILSLLTVTALAAGRSFGIFDFLNGWRTLPEEAKTLVETNPAQKQRPVSDGFPLTCSVEEALCDSESLYLVVQMRAKEQGKWLLLPQDAMEEDKVSFFGLESELSVAAYAEEKGLTPLWIGGGIRNNEELGITTSGMDFRAIADDVMEVMLECRKGSDAKRFPVVFACTARTADATGVEDVMRSELHFTLTDGGTSELSGYLPVSAAVPGTEVRVTRAVVTQTALETYVDVYYCGTPPEDGIFFRLLDADGNALAISGGSGMVAPVDGEYCDSFSVARTEMGEQICLEAYGVGDQNKPVYGTVTLEKE